MKIGEILKQMYFKMCILISELSQCLIYFVCIKIISVKL